MRGGNYGITSRSRPHSDSNRTAEICEYIAEVASSRDADSISILRISCSGRGYVEVRCEASRPSIEADLRPPSVQVVMRATCGSDQYAGPSLCRRGAKPTPPPPPSLDGMHRRAFDFLNPELSLAACFRQVTPFSRESAISPAAFARFARPSRVGIAELSSRDRKGGAALDEKDGARSSLPSSPDCRQRMAHRGHGIRIHAPVHWPLRDAVNGADAVRSSRA